MKRPACSLHATGRPRSTWTEKRNRAFMSPHPAGINSPESSIRSGLKPRFGDQIMPNAERIHVRPHKAIDGLFGGIDNRFVLVERGV